MGIFRIPSRAPGTASGDKTSTTAASPSSWARDGGGGGAAAVAAPPQSRPQPVPQGVALGLQLPGLVLQGLNLGCHLLQHLVHGADGVCRQGQVLKKGPLQSPLQGLLIRGQAGSPDQ